jgi:hypothetical protein
MEQAYSHLRKFFPICNMLQRQTYRRERKGYRQQLLKPNETEVLGPGPTAFGIVSSIRRGKGPGGQAK